MRVLTALCLLLPACLGAAPVQDKAVAPPAKAVAKAAKPQPKEPGKNLKVFKGQGLTEETLDEAMDFMATSLGVSCAHCHVKDPATQAWTMEKDDQPAKQTARQMIQMTRALNKTHFRGETVVTCATCHQGRVKPEGVPPLPVPGAPKALSAEEKVKDLPEVDALLAKWVAGAGGAEALGRISGRVSKGTVDSGGGRTAQLEIVQKPGMRAVTQTTPRGSMKQGFDGTAGWVQRAGKVTPMEARQLAQARIDADLALPLHLKEHYPSLMVLGRERVEGKEVFAVAAQTRDGARLILHFDAASGLLVRRTAYAPTPLGIQSTETAWSDFRAVDGVQVPFKVVNRNAHGASVTTFSEIKAAPVDDGAFKAPAN